MTVVRLFADGGCIAANPSPYGITWAWRHVDGHDLPVEQASGIEFGASLTNNLAELIAVVRGLEALPDGWGGEVCSDSRITLGRLFWGTRLNGIPPAWIKRTAAVLQHLGPCTPVQLDGHPTRSQLRAGRGKRGHPVSVHNVFCDQACTERAQGYLRTHRAKGA